MMTKRVCWLWSHITPKQKIKIKGTEGLEVIIDKTDMIRADHNMVTIIRANGNIVVINPAHIIMICTVSKEFLL